jgi:hypothetical protein
VPTVALHDLLTKVYGAKDYLGNLIRVKIQIGSSDLTKMIELR